MRPIDEVVKRIRRGKVFLISSHINLEGDSLGSELALAYILKRLRKKFFIYNMSGLPRNYRFLPLLDFLKIKRIKEFDTAIILDCSESNRLGEVKKMLTSDKVIINIDHHPDNNYFGTVNWVEPTASAVGELIYKLYKKLKIPLNRDVALCLYTAIMTDTGGFRNENTTSSTHRIIAHLLKYGFKPSSVFENVYEGHSLSRMKLLGLGFDNLKMDKKRKIAWMTISQEMLKKAKADLDDIEGFVEIIRSLKGVKLAILFQELSDNKIKIGFRSREGIDAGKLASIFGGGGHFAASGCIVEGKLEKVEKMVIDRIKKEL